MMVPGLGQLNDLSRRIHVIVMGVGLQSMGWFVVRSNLISMTQGFPDLCSWLGSDFNCWDRFSERKGYKADDKFSVEPVDLEESEALIWRHSWSSGLCGSSGEWDLTLVYILAKPVESARKNSQSVTRTHARPFKWPGEKKAGAGKNAHWGLWGAFEHSCLSSI